MAHTITVCPHCDKDYMYHNSDVKYSDTCQNCYEPYMETRNISYYIDEKAESRGWENALFMAEQKFGVEKVREAIRFQMKRDFPVQDDQWPSRRWNIGKTDYIDL